MKNTEILRTLFILGNSMDIQYGLPTLGQINLFERKILGDDALYEIAQQKMQDGSMPNVEVDSLRKSWDRFCAEETKNHEKIKDYEPYAINYGNNNISMLSQFFYKYLEKEYEIPYKLCLEIGGFSGSLYDLYQNFNPYTMLNKINQFHQNDIKEYEGGKIPLVAENETVEFVFFIFKNHILFVLYDSLNKNFEKTKEFLKLYLTDFSYSALYERLRIERNCKSFSALYDYLDNKSVSNPFKLFIERSKKSDKSPKWTELEKLLPFCSGELKNFFIAKFLLSNTENALQEVFYIPKEKIDEIKNGLKSLLSENEFSHDTARTLANNVIGIFLQDDKDERDPFCGKTNGVASKIIQTAYSLIFYRHKQKKPIQLEKREELVELLPKFAPHSSAFFIPYFKAYIAVTNREFDKAVELFNTAFEYKQFAGDYLIEFLEMAFSFANYYEADWTTTRKSLKEENGIKNPVKCDAKMFKNFGYAINAFPDSAKNSYFEAYRPLEHFYAFFPVECFVDVELAKKIKKQEAENQRDIKIETDGRRNSKFVKNHPYEVLFKLNGKDRNKLIPEKSLFTLNQDHNPKQKDLCPPFVLCIRYSLSDERLLSIAENWLKYPNSEIETTAVSYDGKTALCEALRIYRELKLHFYSNNSDIRNLPVDAVDRICRNGYLEDSEEYEFEIKKIVQKTHSVIQQQKIKLKRYKWLIKQLIERTNWEKELKFGERIPVVSWAIECYDFEIVKLIADKIPDSEFDNYLISANYTTPLVYTILRKEPVSFGLVESIRKHKDIHIPHTMYKTFGFTREEQHSNFLYENPFPKGIDFTKYHMEHWEEQLYEEEVADFISRYGDEATYEEQVSEYDKMIDYFISRTKDINAFVAVISSWAGPHARSDEDKKTSAIQDNQVRSTALVIAAQANDSDTCMKLLKLGAKVDFSVLAEGFTLEQFGETSYQQKHNFIYNLIDYKSWETLIMFLTEFPDIAKMIMHNDEFELNSLVSFAMKVQYYFIWTGRDKREWRPIVQYIVDLFINNGASLDEKTKVGTAREILKYCGLEL